MIQIVLAQMFWQQTTQEGGLSTTLSSNERRHYFISMKSIHLKPMGYSRTQPFGKKSSLLRGDAWDSSEEVGHIIVTIPLRQRIQIVGNRIELGHKVRSNIQFDISLRVLHLITSIFLSSKDDSVERLLCQGFERSKLPVVHLG